MSSSSTLSSSSLLLGFFFLLSFHLISFQLSHFLSIFQRRCLAIGCHFLRGLQSKYSACHFECRYYSCSRLAMDKQNADNWQMPMPTRTMTRRHRGTFRIAAMTILCALDRSIGIKELFNWLSKWLFLFCHRLSIERQSNQWHNDNHLNVDGVCARVTNGWAFFNRKQIMHFYSAVQRLSFSHISVRI